MEDGFYLKLRSHVERHLSIKPKLAIIHALLFTLISVPLGLWGIFSHPVSINGVVYWVIFLWSILLFVHTGYLYLNSGAWNRKREKAIEEEVLDAGETFDLDQDEMLAFHLQLRDDIQKRSQPFKHLVLNALGNLALWPGVLVVMMVLLRTGMDDFTSVFRSVIFLAICGTFLLGFLLPVRQLWQSKLDNDHDLRAVYGYKRKKKGLPEDDRAARLIEREDEDEWAFADVDSKLKRRI